MQTFLPYKSFELSAACLDNRRLGKQRVEAFQILNIVSGTQLTKGWVNHPAVKMWAGYDVALCYYGMAICHEWITRGYKDTLFPKFEQYAHGKEVRLPFWLGRDSFHASHRSNLLRKFKEWYQQFGWIESDSLPYDWPSRSEAC